MKPLFRWTCGSVSSQGLDILEESVFRTMKSLGEDQWDWLICYNDIPDQTLLRLHEIVQGRPVQLFKQSWSDCAIPDECWSPHREDGTIEVDGALCGGTLWKACPARMRIQSHEIVMDNDVVILDILPQIEEFLDSRKTLILEEPIRFFGRYDPLIPIHDRLNSGLMGFPPGYDFAKEIKQIWEEHGSHRRLTQADEQGLLMYVLQCHPNIRIKKNDIRELGAADLPRMYGTEYGFHFVQANRTKYHRSWHQYKEIMIESIPFL